MPVSEFKRGNGHGSGVMQKFSDVRPAACVECGAPVRKVLPPVSISLKGSGCYSSD